MRDAYTGGAQFLAWGDGPSGPWIKILLPESDALAPFRGMTAAKKAMAGQLLAVKIVEVEDLDGSEGGETAPPAGENGAPRHDRTPAGTTPKAPHGKTPQRLSNYAAQLCRQGEFHSFLAQQHWDLWARCLREKDEVPEESAAEFVRHYCGVESRAELDDGLLECVELFHDLREEFAQWMKARP